MNLLILPVLLPLAGAILTLLLRNSRSMQRAIHLVVTGLLVVAGVALLVRVLDTGFIVLRVGSWPAPFGITFVADIFSALMILVSAVVAAAVAITSLGSIDAERERFSYHAFVLFLLTGVNGAFLTGDVFNLYVWFEVLLMGSFVLMTLGSERGQLEGGVKYVVLNLIASAVFLAAVGLLYGMTGSLSMADLAGSLNAAERPVLTAVVAMMFLVAFGIKAAIFPLFFWLPSSYHTPPIPVSALFAGLLTKVGVYALIRFFTLLFAPGDGMAHTIILVLSGLTMLTGVLGAAAQTDVRRILSFHIISQIGYMTMGLGLFTPLALAGSVFYVIHHIVVKTNLFLVSGVVLRARGTLGLKALGGLYGSFPLLAGLFLIPALSLAGLPPLSGFWSKFMLIKAGLDAEAYLITGVALLVGLFTLFSMTKIWGEVFWKPAPEGEKASHAEAGKNWLLLGPVAGLALITVLIGIFAEPLFAVAVQASEQLLQPQAYIAAVLGGGQ